jgi:hydrogenase expression/formation protein HypE
MSTLKDFTLSCPLPITDYPTVTLAHGGGGKLMHQLIETMILPAFKSPLLETRHDGAVFDLGGARLAFTTDSYVVNPLFFPGGDIGSLAINGTVNDLSMCGARPVYLSCGLILEEGLPMETLWAVVQSLKQAAEIAGVQLVTGDTKVVDRGKGDGVFINTAAIGLVDHGMTIAPASVRPGDVVLLSGDLGRHGIAIMAMRQGLEFESQIERLRTVEPGGAGADRRQGGVALPARPDPWRTGHDPDRNCRSHRTADHHRRDEDSRAR